MSNQQENNLHSLEFNNAVDERIKKFLPQYLQTAAFMTRKLTDTPTDAFQVVSRQYVTLNGPSANRPTSSVVGQFYYDTGVGKPIWWNGSTFKDAAGNTV